jgi:hypothetical protein
VHQVRELSPDGTVLKADDLPEALDLLPGVGPWRVHFHVPLHAEPDEPLGSTNEVITEVLRAVPADRTVEVETYTWNVLPERHRQDLVAGIVAELAWASGQLSMEIR